MRKPRDFDSELKALADKAKQLKERRVQQLGELVIATGADATDAETLAGALLVIAETSEACGSAWKKDPGSGVIGVEKGPLIPVV